MQPSFLTHSEPATHRARLADDVLQVFSAFDPLLLPLAGLIAVELPGTASAAVVAVSASCG